MLDNEFRIKTDAKAALVSIQCEKLPSHATSVEVTSSLAEMWELMRTLSIETVGEYVQVKDTPSSATILGSGKLEEIAEDVKTKGGDLLVFDFELTSGQIRNIKKLTGLSVVDRCHVILEIFAKHARTKEAKIQIEMARLEYLLPRLSGFWSHLSRQKGGIGVRGGEGEQQIELDRRIVRSRIAYFKRELGVIVKSRKEQNKRRGKKTITAALVGYTNAGKSSVMNRLCQEQVIEEDMLFATLDSTYRMLSPDTKPPMVLIDTVGFISNLPNTLISGFKTTLESAIEADLLIVVCDISNPFFEQQLSVTNQVLDELKIGDKERFLVFNKIDKADPFTVKLMLRKYSKMSIAVSTFNPEDMKQLRSQIIDYFLSKQGHYDLFVPYALGDIHSSIRSQTNIIGEGSHEKGIFYRIKAPDFIVNRLNIEKYMLASPVRDDQLIFR